MRGRDSIARKYAVAFLRQGGTIRDEGPLLALGQALKEESRLLIYCDHPGIALTEKEGLIKAVLGKSASELLLRLLNLLLRHHQLPLVSCIAAQLRVQLDLKEGVQALNVTSEKVLTPAQRSRLSALLEKQWGSKVRLLYGTDPELLGGFIIQSKTWILDQSVRGRLAAFREQLFNN